MFSLSELWQHWEIGENWKLDQGKHKRIQGRISRKTHLLRGWLLSTSPRFLNKSKRVSLKKLSPEFSRTESRLLGALSKLDEFLLNLQVRTCSVAFPRTSPNNDSENRESTRDRSLNDSYPEVELSACRTSKLTDSDPEETSHTYKGKPMTEMGIFLSPWAFLFEKKGYFLLEKLQFEEENDHRCQRILCENSLLISSSFNCVNAQLSWHAVEISKCRSKVE